MKFRTDAAKAAISVIGTPNYINEWSIVIGGIPRPEARSTERRGAAREVFGETIARSKRQSER
jgi:hypothetical protein